MRKIFFLLVMVLGSAGFAQTNLQGYWAGVSFGVPATAFHFGAEDVLGNGGDLRGTVGFSYLYSSGIYLGGDALFALNMDSTAPIDPYVGVGAFTSIGGGFGLGVQGLIGAEYRLVDAGFPEGGIFFEVGPDLYFAPRVFLGLTGRLGFNYHF